MLLTLFGQNGRLGPDRTVPVSDPNVSRPPSEPPAATVLG